MEESKLDIMASKENQLKVLVPYLEEAAKGIEEEESELPLTTQTKVLISRYLWNWTDDLYNNKGLTPKGAFLYYRRIKGGDECLVN